MGVKTKTVYLPVERETNSAVCRWDELWLEWKMSQYIELHSNMVVLTKEQYEADKKKTAEDAFDAGRESMKGPAQSKNKTQHLTQLFGEGETTLK